MNCDRSLQRAAYLAHIAGLCEGSGSDAGDGWLRLVAPGCQGVFTFHFLLRTPVLFASWFGVKMLRLQDRCP